MSRAGTLIAIVALLFASMLLPQPAEAATVKFWEVGKESTAVSSAALINRNCIVRERIEPSGNNTEPTIDAPDDWPESRVAYHVASEPIGRVYFCSPLAVQEAEQAAVNKAAVESLPNNPVFIAIVFALNYTMTLIASLGNWLLWLSSKFLGPMLGVSSFITNPFVQTGWPFVQGIANLGFLLALLFIAFATTLQLQVASARRMLPRLLIAALLINFSLVIAGLIIDGSRLVMAIEVQALQQDNAGLSIANLGGQILKQSELIGGVFNTATQGPFGGLVHVNLWSPQLAFQTAQAAILIWGLAIGFIVLVAGLFVRYVVLVLLLIVSPLAYLAIAVPRAEGYAIKWWSAFLKYVFYGPIAVFIIMLVVAITNTSSPASGRNILNQPREAGFSFLDSLLQVAVISAMLVVAATAGRRLGFIGAGATLSFLGKQGQRARGLGLWAGRQTSGYLYRRSGLKDLVDERTQAKKRAEKQRSKQSFGRQLGKSMYEDIGLSPEKIAQRDQERGWAQEAKNAQTRSPFQGARDPALAAMRLRSKEVGKELNNTQIRSVVDRAVYDADNNDQIRSMVGNSEIVAKMDIETQHILQNELRTRMLNPTLSQEEKDEVSQIQLTLNQSIRDAERRAERGSGSTSGDQKKP